MLESPLSHTQASFTYDSAPTSLNRHGSQVAVPSLNSQSDNQGRKLLFIVVVNNLGQCSGCHPVFIAIAYAATSLPMEVFKPGLQRPPVAAGLSFNLSFLIPQTLEKGNMCLFSAHFPESRTATWTFPQAADVGSRVPCNAFHEYLRRYSSSQLSRVLDSFFN